MNENFVDEKLSKQITYSLLYLFVSALGLFFMVAGYYVLPICNFIGALLIYIIFANKLQSKP